MAEISVPDKMQDEYDETGSFLAQIVANDKFPDYYMQVGRIVLDVYVEDNIPYIRVADADSDFKAVFTLDFDLKESSGNMSVYEFAYTTMERNRILLLDRVDELMFGSF